MNCNAKLIFLIEKLGILNYYFLIMDQPTKFLISIFDEGKLFLIQTLCEGMSFSLKQKKLVTHMLTTTDSFYLYDFDMIPVGYWHIIVPNTL